MIGMRSVIFYDLCRICTSSSEHKMDIFSPEGKRKKLSAKINECLSLIINEEDRLPKVLCMECLQHVESILEFRNLCQNSQTKLNGWLNTAMGHNAEQKQLSDYEQSENVLQISTASTEQRRLDKSSDIGQYSLTIDAGLDQQQGNNEQTTTNENNELDLKNHALEEFLKMKPNIKVTSIKKKQQQQQQQQQQQLNQEQQQDALQQEHLKQQQQQQLQQQQQQQQEQLQLQQLQQQLQQQIQQQLQQQQLQQQIQLLTSQLQPQPITISAAAAAALAPAFNATHPANTLLNNSIAETNITNFNNTLNGNDELSPSKCKKPKLNFVFSSPTTANLASGLMQQQTPNASAQTPQIQLQFQPQPQQQQTNLTAATLLSNLAPLLQTQAQPQTLNAVLQNPNLTAAQSILSANKCFLPITIKDEASDQQFIAHIDAKNFLLPTTYQLQMKLQPQIATVDGQPIMQLAPTSIPATLQITPQNQNTAQAFPSAAMAALSSNTIIPAQLIQTQTHQQQQQQHMQTIPTAAASVTLQADVIQQQQQNIQQGDLHNTQYPDAVKAIPNGSDPTDANTVSVYKQQKYKVMQNSDKNSLELIPTNDLTQQILQQVQQQQQQQQSNTQSIITQHGGITVQRITNRKTARNSEQSTANNQTNKQQQQHDKHNDNFNNKLHLLNKQNLTISRITNTMQATKAPDNGQQRPQQSQQQQGTKVTVQQQRQQSTSTPQRHQYQQTKITPTKQSTSPTNKLTTTAAAVAALTSLKMVTSPIRINTTTQAYTITAPSAITAPVQTNPTNTITTTAAIKNTTAKATVKRRITKANNNNNNQTVNAITVPPSNSQTVDTTKQIPQDSLLITTAKTDSQQASKYAKKISADTKASSRAGLISIKISESSTANTVVSSTTTAPMNTPSSLTCPTCGRLFKKKEHLSQHVKLHAGIRPFKCTEAECTKAFSRKEHLHRHLVSHSGKKMFTCDICQKPFSRKDNLSKHRRMHTDPGSTNKYACDICHKRFAVKSYYEQHKERHKNTSKTKSDQKAANDNAEKKPSASASASASLLEAAVLQTFNDINNEDQQRQHLHHQQIQLVRHQLQQQNSGQAAGPEPMQMQVQSTPQIMHLQLSNSLPSNLAVGNTITITQASNQHQEQHPNDINMKAVNGNRHDTTVLNLPTSLANFVQQTQLVNTATGQIMGHLKFAK